MNKATQLGIVQEGDAVLRDTAKDVPVKEITSKKIRDILARMSAALAREDDGVALAAPQIGVPLRIFVLSGKIHFLQYQEENPDATSEEFTSDIGEKDLVFINPVITKRSRTKVVLDEGCLSVRGTYGKVTRATKATVRAYDENGQLFERGAKGLMAQAFQHEVDHLDGVLFIDKATDLFTIDPEELKAQQVRARQQL
jgi:peptide deformylase